MTNALYFFLILAAIYTAPNLAPASRDKAAGVYLVLASAACVVAVFRWIVA
jgi:hypothetical protein